MPGDPAWSSPDASALFAGHDNPLLMDGGQNTPQLLSNDTPVVNLQVETFLNWWLEGENGVSYTPGGLAYTASGQPLPDAMNAAFLALAYGDSLQDTSRQVLSVSCIKRDNDCRLSRPGGLAFTASGQPGQTPLRRDACSCSGACVRRQPAGHLQASTLQASS